MNETRTRIVEEALHLVRIRGYASVSYADLERVVGIRKASIHHHFPSKTDLGVAMVQVYSAQFLSRLRSVGVRRAGIIGQLSFYAGLYREALERGEACLCGTLAAEVVPESISSRVAEFFAANVDWLAARFTEGVSLGEIASDVDPRRSAQAFLATVQGAALTARSLGDVEVFNAAIGATIRQLQPARERAEAGAS
ncbi:TetR/AcrR family transcriptional regulator [Plantibacter sp. Mn2098]|uniref:TetR/AcrR family transcriptional regulator n=1 Tax=Plantibacter sp. Mn2098 TaxID=3395266 RepID=UPI003BC5C63A